MLVVPLLIFLTGIHYIISTTMVLPINEADVQPIAHVMKVVINPQVMSKF